MSPSFTAEETFQLPPIDHWFLTQIQEIVDFKEELAEGDQLATRAT